MAASKSVFFIAPTVPVYVFVGKEAGPTILIQGGIHGDEVAGVHALAECVEAGVSLDRGRLLVVPVMNPGAYRARQRSRQGGLDLNRCFPGDGDSEHIENRLAAAFMALVETEKPMLVCTLHESWKRHHPEIKVSFGQSVVYGVLPMPEVVDYLVSYMNARLENPYERWAENYFPVATSSTEIMVDRFGCTGLCIETWMGFEEERRIVMQKQVIAALLRYYALVD